MDHVAGTISAHEASVSVAKQTWHFVRHFIEMCIAMCIGVAVFGALYVWIAGQFGVAQPYLQFPEMTAFVMAINMTLPMVLWMRFRGMGWRPVVEMSGAMVAEAIVLVLAYWLGAIQNAAVGTTSTLWLWQHGLMMPVMLLPMLLRLDVYTGMHHEASAMQA